MAQLALYKGPPKDWAHKVAHWAICVFTASPYSHVELLIDGMGYSSSSRDGGVRSKFIDLSTGRWDVVEVECDEDYARRWFDQHKGTAYDWWGIVRFVIPFVPQSKGQWFCSEAVAAMLGFKDPAGWTPSGLHDTLAAGRKVA